MSNETTGPQGSGRWSVKRSAVTVAVALLLTSAGAVGAAVALPAGSTGADTGRNGSGPARWGQTPNGTTGRGGPGLGIRQNGSQLPSQLGGAQADPNQQDPTLQNPTQQDPLSPTPPAAPGSGSSVLDT